MFVSGGIHQQPLVVKLWNLQTKLLYKETNECTLVPCVLVTKVLPTLRLEKLEGALTSYQSFFEKGSTLQP